jgi:hypothetical protein
MPKILWACMIVQTIALSRSRVEWLWLMFEVDAAKAGSRSFGREWGGGMNISVAQEEV